MRGLDLLRAGYGNASYLELAWTYMACLGLVVTLALAVDAWLDLRALTRAGTFKRGGPRHIIAVRNLRGLLVRALVLLLFIYLGYLALRAPPPPAGNPGADRWVLSRIFLVIGIEAVFIWSTLVDQRDRQRIFALETAWVAVPPPEAPTQDKGASDAAD